MARTELSADTIDKWWRGHVVQPSTRLALEKAAKAMRMLVPPRPAKAVQA